jgi:two-component system LytT family response regulator
MRCIVVDDEVLVRELLEDNIRQIPYLQLVKSCKNALEATDVIQSAHIDLVYLDVQMPGLSGLQFIQSLPRPPLVIMVTAYEQYALKGFDLDVVDYILKPFTFERFLKASNRAYELFKLTQHNEPLPGDLDSFFVHVEYTLVKIAVSEILYIEGLKDYIKIYLSSSEKPVITRMTIKAIEEKLPSTSFIRTHKSYLVAADKVTVVKRDLLCIGKKEIPVSDSYKQNVYQKLSL